MNYKELHKQAKRICGKNDVLYDSLEKGQFGVIITQNGKYDLIFHDEGGTTILSESGEDISKSKLVKELSELNK